MNDTTYTCPHAGCGEPQHLDTDFFDWDDDGTAQIGCSKCERPYTIARPVSAGFGGGEKVENP